MRETILLVAVVVNVAALAWALVDIFRSSILSSDAKRQWRLCVVLLGLVGIGYYVLVGRNRNAGIV